MNQTPDQLHRFIFENYEIRGELVQLNQTTRDMLSGHHYPLAIQRLLSELLVATSLLTATLKFEGSITVQLQGDGPVRFAVINGDHQQQLRGVARYEGVIAENAGLHELIGKGHMMITITPDEGERYQGIVALDGDTLAACLESYFAQSEQLPTRIWLKNEQNEEHPAAAGMLIQSMPNSNNEQQALDYEHVITLTDTIKSEELLNLPAEEILYRLYHQEQVRLFEPQAVNFVCTCSRARCESALQQLGKDEVDSILEERDEIRMDCDYCGTEYHFTANDVAHLFNDQQTPPAEEHGVLH
ncbi:Hsp33 family molecular chaperone HslO [Tolumonas lignilytica]|jgi:Disulfide bond chaperones of the HSP33 family|uniref:Hsp33 family molecular chaperone HslO n=1 Tax=Tolumonas lignilytica TaxID=1283284 RepID=UPI000465FD6B|nr:Hsp33 family molecular chaperone HslO [Tolumonas lignilytica]